MLCPECGVVVTSGPMRARKIEERCSCSPVVVTSDSEGCAFAVRRGVALTSSSRRQAEARTSFVRLMVWSLVAAVAMSVTAVGYLAYKSVDLTAAVLIATGLGVFLSVVLGAGLMAVGFLSSNSGHDENVADHRNHADKPLR